MGMAANYDTFGNNRNYNSLVMKLTPVGSRSPSMLFLGDFQGATLWNTLIDMSEHYQKVGKEEIKDGLLSDVLMVPHHGARSEGNNNEQIYNEIFRGRNPDGTIPDPDDIDEDDKYFKPTRAFSIISADIDQQWPQCAVIKNIIS